MDTKATVWPVGARRFNKLMAEKQELEQKAAKLREDLDRTCQKIKEKDDSIKTLNSSIKTLNSSIETAKTVKKELDDERKELVQTIKDLENDNAELQKKYDKLEAKYKRESKSASDIIKDTTHENAKLQLACDRQKMNYNTLQRRLDATVEEALTLMKANPLYARKTEKERKALLLAHVQERFEEISKADKEKQERVKGRYAKRTAKEQPENEESNED